MNQQQLVEAIRAEFENRLALKPGWGKNEVMHQFDLSVSSVLLQGFAERRVTPPSEDSQRRLDVASRAMQALITLDKFTVGMGEPSKYAQVADQALTYADNLMRRWND